MDFMEFLSKYQVKIIETAAQIFFVIVFAVIALKIVRILGNLIHKVVMSNAEKISREEFKEFEKRILTIKSLLIAK